MIPKRGRLSSLTTAQLSDYAARHTSFVATTSAVADHQAWHGRHGSGSDAHFLLWHRYYIRRLEDFLGGQGAHELAPIPYWPSDTPIPAQVSAGTANANPGVAPPTWTTMAGGGAADPVSGHTSLGQFRTTAELGAAIGFGYHGQVHGQVGGVMSGFNSPEAPIFFPWHGFVDHIWAEWERRCLPPPVAVVRGNAGSPDPGRIRINLFVRRNDGRLWERYWNGSAWSWSDTGREVFGRPMIVVRGDVEGVEPEDLRLNLFVQGSDRFLWERYWNGSSWSWINTGKQVDGEPLVLVRGHVGSPDAAGVRINLFVRGLDGRLWERYWNGAVWSWIDTGKDVAGDPIAVMRGDVEDTGPEDLRINLFVRGADGQLWERYWDGAGWSWIDTGKAVADDPVAIIRGNDGSPDAAHLRINLWVRGADGRMWERYWDGAGWSWIDTGKGIRGRAVPILRGNRKSVHGGDVRINLFVHGTDGKLWERYWNGSAWSWSDTGQPADGEPVAVVRGNVGSVGAEDLRINLFVPVLEASMSAGPSPHPHFETVLWERYWNGTSWSWTDTGRAIRGRPAVIVRGDVEAVGPDDVRINLFVAGDDGSLWERYWNGGAWSWSNTGGSVPT